MKKKIIWILVSCLMVLSLIMASCGTTETEEEGEAETGPEEPEYGGTVNVLQNQEASTFDECAGGMSGTAWTLNLTNEEILEGDWSKGQAGTGEFLWTTGGAVTRMDSKIGRLAESWEIPEVGHIIWNIRQGVHFALDPDSDASRLVNGRELTAEDIVYSVERYKSCPKNTMSFSDMKHTVLTAPDKWTVDVTIPPQMFPEMERLGDWCSIIPKEVVEEYGDMVDWKNSVGTGPFMLKEYIVGSSATLDKNPDYWQKDPVGLGKGNQIPYIDTVKILVVPDTSTQMAAIRTAKVDRLAVLWSDAGNLKQTNPDLLYKKFSADGGLTMSMKLDNPELPFQDKNVRHALLMATDFETIVDDYYEGDAQILTFPFPYIEGYENAHLSLEEAPAEIQELYSYNPTKAKQLLTDAGYPDGFPTKITCRNIPAEVDYLSIIKDQWSKVDVDLTIEPVDTGAFFSLWVTRAWEEMGYCGMIYVGNIYLGWHLAGPLNTNASMIDDPLAWECKNQMGALGMTDTNAADRIHKEFMPYALDQAWAIPAPWPSQYCFWWPWLKNYHGENSIGSGNLNLWTKYAWIDQDLKESMGY
ncbi:ABC transporter substrate-binding protein [Chloroflexota bacterium]